MAGRGNVRELQNIIERSVIVCDTDMFSVDESWIPRDQKLAVRLRSESPRLSLTKQDRAKRERDVIEAALAAARGRVSGQLGAAAKLGMPPSTLESRIRSLQIDKHRFKRSIGNASWRNGTFVQPGIESPSQPRHHYPGEQRYGDGGGERDAHEKR